MLLIGKWRDNLAPGAHEKVIAKSDDSDDEQKVMIVMMKVMMAIKKVMIVMMKIFSGTWGT